MRAKLGYKNRLVEVSGNKIFVFKGKLYTASIDEVIKYYLSGFGVLPSEIREVSNDVVRFLLKTGELETIMNSRVQYSESLSD